VRRLKRTNRKWIEWEGRREGTGERGQTTAITKAVEGLCKDRTMFEAEHWTRRDSLRFGQDSSVCLCQGETCDPQSDLILMST
jgi:hypothetical protein